MPLVRLAHETDFEGWRTAARSLLAQDIAPREVEWRVGEGGNGLFDPPEFVPATVQGPQFSVPRDFISLCRTAILHQSPARFSLLSRLLWQLREQPGLLQVSFDPYVSQVREMRQAGAGR